MNASKRAKRKLAARPNSLHGVAMHFTDAVLVVVPGIFPFRVTDRPMLPAGFRHPIVSRRLVRIKCRILPGLGLHLRLNRALTSVVATVRRICPLTAKQRLGSGRSFSIVPRRSLIGTTAGGHRDHDEDRLSRRILEDFIPLGNGVRQGGWSWFNKAAAASRAGNSTGCHSHISTRRRVAVSTRPARNRQDQYDPDAGIMCAARPCS